MRSGAGGSWKVINERTDPSVPAQSTPLGCVAATGEMLLKALGVSMRQERILAKIGELADPRDLAPILNEIENTPGKWRGFQIEPTERARNYLNSRGAWEQRFVKVVRLVISSWLRE